MTTVSRRRALLAATTISGLVCTFASPAAAQQTIVVPAGTTDATQKTVGGTDSVTVQAGGTLQTTTNPAINWSTAATGLTITNSGTIRSTNTGGRAIGTSGNATQRSVTLTNNTGALIESQDDAVRINVDANATSTIVVDNAGTIRSTAGGQAIDFDAITAGGASVTINNRAGGTIQSTGQDALRPGQGATVTNAGLIRSDGAANNSYDGVDLQGHSATINNLAGGTISGLRHGITSDVGLTVVNNGTIIGRNGSGVGSDGTGTVTNFGTISGRYDGVATNGDGDGVDIDFIATVRNFGVIEGTGAAGVDSGGRPNSGQGVAIGGGTVENNAGASIFGAAQGILVNHDTNPGGVADGATTVTNAGTIRGGTAEAIQFVGVFDDTITNSGTITAGTGGRAIDMGDGNDRLNLLGGSVITGIVDGGTGTDTVALGGTGGSFAGAVNFERLLVQSGTWSLTAPSNFAAGTSIASGATLGGTTTTLTGAIADAGTLRIDQASDGTFGAALSGNGFLVKAGSGTLTIGDQAGFTGATQIVGGRLNVAGSLPSTVSVESGGSLGGTGRLGTTTVRSGGTIAPGIGDIGTLSVNGTFVQATGSTYAAETNAAGTSDLIAVNGNAVIQNGATLALSGSYTIGQRYTLLAASGGIAGTYSAITQAATGIEFRQSNVNNAISVQVSRTAAALGALGQTSNQLQTAAGLAPLGVGNAAYAAITLIPDAGATLVGLDQLSGELHGSVRTVMVHDADYAEAIAASRLDQAAPDGRLRIWGQFTGGTGTDYGALPAQRIGRDTVGGFGGVEMTVGDNGVVGLGGGYTHTVSDSAGDVTRATFGTIHAIGYFGLDLDHVQLRASAGYAASDISTRRSVAFSGFADRLSADYDGETIHGVAELGYVSPVGRHGSVELFGGVRAYQVRTDGFAETGGAATLRGDRRRETVVFSEFGAKATADLGGGFSLLGTGTWRHGFDHLRGTSTLAFAGGPAVVVAGTPLSRDAAAPSVDLRWQAGETVMVKAGYAGLYGDGGYDHRGHVTVSIGF